MLGLCFLYMHNIYSCFLQRLVECGSFQTYTEETIIILKAGQTSLLRTIYGINIVAIKYIELSSKRLDS